MMGRWGWMIHAARRWAFWSLAGVLVSWPLVLLVLRHYGVSGGLLGPAVTIRELQAYGTFVAGLVGLFVVWATLRRTQAMEDRARALEAQVRLTEQGQITERFTRAVGQLGATDDQGNPRLEIRLGGIYSLERIAKDSEADHWTVMEILTAYVRENARWRPDADAGAEACADGNAGEGEREEGLPVKTFPPGVDVQAILDVIGRRRWRDSEPAEVHLGETDLRGADFRDADF